MQLFLVCGIELATRGDGNRVCHEGLMELAVGWWGGEMMWPREDRVDHAVYFFLGFYPLLHSHDRAAAEYIIIISCADTSLTVGEDDSLMAFRIRP